MARAKFISDESFEVTLSKAEAKYPEIAAKAMYAGAAIIADEMKRRLRKILSPNATGQLVAAFGITPVKQDLNMNYNLHIGFDGYQKPGYGKWRGKGVPFQLIARSFESGAKGWRTAKPFAAPAVRAVKEQAVDEMKRAAEAELEKIVKGTY